MKHFQTLLGLAAFLLAGAARADDASRTAKAEELFQVAKMDQGFRQLLEHAQATIKAQTGRQAPAGADKAALDQKVSEILSQQMNWDKLRPQYVKVYVDTYTEAELDGVLAFYKSPAGQAWFAKSPELGDKTRLITQQAIQESQAQIRKLIEQAAPKEDAPPK